MKEETPEFVEVSRVFKASRKVLWAALTERSQLNKWYFTFPENWKLELGYEFEWSAGDQEGALWLHKGKILEIVEFEVLAHSWEYPGYSGSSIVRWELIELMPNLTELVLTHTFVEPFDESVEALGIGNFEMGWTSIIHDGLPAYLGEEDSYTL